MSNNDTTIPDGLAPYADDQDIYRAVIYPDWIKPNDTIKHQAFFLLRKDTHGLSVNPTPDDCRNNPEFTAPIHGLLHLVVGQVRNEQRQDTGENLEVIPSTPTHGNIKRLPYRDENQIEATRLARELAAIARVYEKY
jgi:hypothetical protein